MKIATALQTIFSKRSLLRMSFSVVVVVLCVGTNSVQALTSQQLFNYANEEVYFVDDPCGNGPASTPAGQVDPSKEQEHDARTIIGVAKTMNLTQKAALIAFMTVYQESHFNNYANDGGQLSGQQAADIKTFSESNPNSGGVPSYGSDHDSVGIFQQRPLAGWSTFDNNAITKDTVWQIMGSVKSDQAVAYSAEAFFGSPDGATLPDGLRNPGALKKGLLNKVPNYNDASVQPGVAAQTVQVSAFPDAYNKWQTQAQQLVDQYWNDSPAVPLPIPFTGGEAPVASAAGSCQVSITGYTEKVNKMLSKIAEYAWPDYRRAGTKGATQKKAEYQRALSLPGAYNGDTCFGGGVDCGAFVTHVVRDSGADPNYNKSNGDTTAQKDYLLENSATGAQSEGKAPKYQHLLESDVVKSGYLQPGDIAVKDGHTWIWVGNAIPNFHGEAASASQCERAPMAGPADTLTDYEWFRIL